MPVTLPTAFGTQTRRTGVTHLLDGVPTVPPSSHELLPRHLPDGGSVVIDIGPVGLWTALLDAHPATRVCELGAELEAMGWPCLWRPETAGRDDPADGPVGRYFWVSLAPTIACATASRAIGTRNGEQLT